MYTEPTVFNGHVTNLFALRCVASAAILRVTKKQSKKQMPN